MEKSFFVNDKSTTMSENLRRFKDPVRMRILRDEASQVFQVTVVNAASAITSSPRVVAAQIFTLNFIAGRQLKSPLSAIVEPDGDSYIARTPDLPLYGSGDDSISAIEALNREIASLYEDLQQDDNYTEEWLRIKAFFRDNLL
jgi:hypothetical protein